MQVNFLAVEPSEVLENYRLPQAAAATGNFQQQGLNHDAEVDAFLCVKPISNPHCSCLTCATQSQRLTDLLYLSLSLAVFDSNLSYPCIVRGGGFLLHPLYPMAYDLWDTRPGMQHSDLGFSCS